MALMLGSVFCYAQQPPGENLWKGLERFKIGADISPFQNRIESAEGGIETSGKEKKLLYSYLPAPDSPFIFAGIKFTLASLKVNSDGKLTAIELHAVYWVFDTSINYTIAEKHYKQVLAYLESRLSKAAIHEAADKDDYKTAREYLWQKDNLQLIFAVHIKKRRSKKEKASVFSILLREMK